MINNKLKSLYIRNGITQKDIATQYNMSSNSFNNKFRDCETRFNISDLIKFAEINHLKIAFVNDNNEIIETLTKEDLKKDL